MTTSLGKAVHQTIQHLEYIRDHENTPPAEIYSMLDTLYTVQIKLIDSAIKKATQEYINATAAMEEAAASTQKAINDLKKLENAIEKIAAAIEKIAPLITVVI